tara:strand:+ start:669 stop:1082 length:414 start_codon:yes stop_codon:yes gene_type:complete
MVKHWVKSKIMIFKIIFKWCFLSLILNASFAVGGDIEHPDKQLIPKNNAKNLLLANKELDRSLTGLESIVSEQNKKALEKEIDKSLRINRLSHTYLSDDEVDDQAGEMPLFDGDHKQFHYSWKLLISFAIVIFVSAL